MPLPGDFNNDGHVNSADIPAMLAALADLNGYQSSRGISNADLLAIADVNGDGTVNNADLQTPVEPAQIRRRLTGCGTGTGDSDIVAAGALLGLHIRANLRQGRFIAELNRRASQNRSIVGVSRWKRILTGR